MLNARETILRQASDEDFQWMLDGEPISRCGLRLPPGGVDDPSILTHIREIARRVLAQGSSGTWMIVCDDEVVGLCGYHDAPTEGLVEIGYSVAASRRRRGHATLAVTAMIAEARACGVQVLRAETSVANRASSRVLEKNGFVQGGTRVDADDCAILAWHKRL